MRRIRITNAQFGALVGQFLYVSTLTIPARTMQVTGASAWISVFIGGIGGLLALVLAFLLAGPQRVDLFQACEQRLGAFAGRFLSACYALFLLLVVTWDLRWASDYYAGIALQRTPLLVILGSWTLVLALVVLHGPEVICRANMASFLFMIVMITAIPFMAMNNLHVEYFTPLFENGIGPTLRASYIPAGWTATSIALSVFLPYTAVNQQTRRSALIGAAVGLFLLQCMMVATIGAFGPDLGPSFTYPAVALIRMIAPIPFLDRLDYALVTAWQPAFSLKMAATLYAATVALTRAFGLRHPRPLTLTAAMFLFTLSYWGWRTQARMLEFGMVALPGLSLVMGILVPGIVVLFPVSGRSDRRKGVAPK